MTSKVSGSIRAGKGSPGAEGDHLLMGPLVGETSLKGFFVLFCFVLFFKNGHIAAGNGTLKIQASSQTHRWQTDFDPSAIID